jgi:cytoskeletal protein CcmA (bactofilin family)
MAEAGNNDFPTILGPDANFKGELTYEKGMRLQGKFEGNILTPGRLHITKEARMNADVDAGSISVEGDVKGKLSANERVELKQSAKYEGDLTAAKLVVDEGAMLSGHVHVAPDAVKSGPAKPAHGGGAHTPPGGGSGGGNKPANIGMPVPQGQPVK